MMLGPEDQVTPTPEAFPSSAVPSSLASSQYSSFNLFSKEVGQHFCRSISSVVDPNLDIALAVLVVVVALVVAVVLAGTGICVSIVSSIHLTSYAISCTKLTWATSGN